MQIRSGTSHNIARYLPVAVFVAVTAIFLARPLFGLGTLLPIDIVDGAAPWKAENASSGPAHNAFLSDTLDVHTHFASLGAEIRNGTSSWWDRSIGGGIPSLKGGLSPLMWLYLLVPAWYAPGLVAAARTLLAAGLAYGFLRELRVSRTAATVGGIAYCINGYMIAWASWPQSNVAAFLPGLFWVVERIVRQPSLRRSIPLALVTAAMIVSNFPIVTAYGMFGAAAYGVWRLAGQTGGAIDLSTRLRVAGRTAVISLWGITAGVLLAGLHLLTFSEYFGWADTTARESIPADSSIGGRYLITVLFPRPFGAAHMGEPFWGGGTNWVEATSYAGVGVLVLAMVALTTVTRRRGGTGDGAVRAEAVRALWVIAILIGWLTYAGGPLTELTQSVPMLGQNPVGRARVVMNLALAVLAGLGVQAWADARRGKHVVDLRHGVRTAAIGLGAFAVLTFGFWLDWVREARAKGLLVETAGSLLVPLVAGAAVLVLLWWSRPSRRTHTLVNRFGTAAVVVVAAELLIFAMPVATVVDRDKADFTTPAHDVAIDALGPGERLGGDARTFFANTAQVSGFDDVRGHLLPAQGWLEIYFALDTEHTRASPTNAWFQDVDLANPALDRLAVGVWAVDPSVPLSGGRGPLVFPDRLVEVGAELVAGPQIVIPDGGLRAITVTTSEASAGVLTVEVESDGRSYQGTTEPRLTRSAAGQIDIAMFDIDAVPGTIVSTRFSWSGIDPLPVAATAGGIAATTVADDDGFGLLRSGDVVLYSRPTATAAWLAGAVVESDEPITRGMHSTTANERAVVVPPGSDLELPSQPTTVDGDAVVTRAEGGSIDIDVTTAETALLVVSQPDYPGWKAFVDGKETRIHEADGAFQGVVVPAGTHEVTLRYTPSNLRLGTVATIAGVVMMGLAWTTGRRRRPVPVGGAVSIGSS